MKRKNNHLSYQQTTKNLTMEIQLLTLGRHKNVYIYMDVVEWSRALDVRLSEWCCSVSMVWVQIPSREEQNLTALKSNSNTVWFNFQTYIYKYIYYMLVILDKIFLNKNATHSQKI